MRARFLSKRTLIIKAERIDYMAVALKEDYQRALDEQKKRSSRACNGWIGTDKRGKDKRL